MSLLYIYIRLRTKNTKEQKPHDAHVIFFTPYEFVSVDIRRKNF